jgi:hypothetical protein
MPTLLLCARFARSYGRPVRSEEPGFLESVFSYVFGDGDPNGQLEEVRVRAAAKVIRANQGAVTAEQLAPFVDVPDGADLDLSDERSIVDESFVLPIVSKLGGIPQAVGEDIVYVFPELKKSGLSTAALTKLMGVSTAEEYEEATALRAGVELPTDVLQVRGAAATFPFALTLTPRAQEAQWEFSSASSTNLLLSGALGVVNLGGVLYLSNLLSAPALQGMVLPGIYGLVQVRPSSSEARANRPGGGEARVSRAPRSPRSSSLSLVCSLQPR